LEDKEKDDAAKATDSEDTSAPAAADAPKEDAPEADAKDEPKADAKSEDAPKSEARASEATEDADDEEAPPSAASAAAAKKATVDELAKRVAALGDDDETERRAREEEEKLAARRAEAKKAKKKGGLESSATKKLSKIGTKSKERRAREEEEEAEVDVARAKPYADPIIERTRKLSAWAQKNRAVVGYAVAAAVIAVVGSFVYLHFQKKNETDASTALAHAVADEQGLIGDPDKDDDEGPKDPRPIFKTADARRDSALAKYKEVESKFGGTGAAIMARLAEGSILLDKHQPDDAIKAFTEVKDSPLAKVDLEIRGRALEGLGFAYELKGQTKEALGAFKELENAADIRGFKELAMYHQARCYMTLGEKDKAKELLMSVRERISKPGESHPFGYLGPAVDDRIRAIDPKAIPEPQGGGMPGMGGPGGKTSPAQMKQMQEMIRKMQEKMKQGGGAPDPHGGMP
jgi:hypothetical protein